MIDFTNLEILTELRRRVVEIVDTIDVPSAKMLASNLEYLVEQPEEATVLASKPEILEELKSLVVQLKAVSLSALPEGEVIEILQHSAGYVVAATEVDLVARIRGKLLTLPVFADRDLLRRKLRQAISENTERITSQDIKVDTSPVAPTIANWIRKYSLAVGATPVSLVQKNQFLSADPDVTKLKDEAEKAVLRKIIDLYEYLKLSSQTPEGLEDPVLVRVGDELKVLKQGAFEDIKIPSHIEQFFRKAIGESPTPTSSAPVATPKSISPLEKRILEVLAGAPGQEKKIGTLIDQLTARKLMGQVVRDELFAAVQQKDTDRAIALLRYMAMQNEFEPFLTTDQKLRPFLATTWEAKYGAGAGDEFLRAAATPKQVRRFVRYILQDRLGLSESLAAQQAARLGQLFVRVGKNQYTKMAYYDAVDSAFHWFGDTE